MPFSNSSFGLLIGVLAHSVNVQLSVFLFGKSLYTAATVQTIYLMKMVEPFLTAEFKIEPF